jgi:hypothetical protein
MTNLTVVIDDDLLRAARIKALQQGTSVNEICRQAIERFAAPLQDPAERMRKLRELRAENMASREPGFVQEPTWANRDEMYDEILAERLPTLWATFDKTEAPAATTPAKSKPAATRKRRTGDTSR